MIMFVFYRVDRLLKICSAENGNIQVLKSDESKDRLKSFSFEVELSGNEFSNEMFIQGWENCKR